MYRQYYRDVTKAEVLDSTRAKFTFKDGKNPELPLIIGQMSVLPKHYWENRDFTKAGLKYRLEAGHISLKAPILAKLSHIKEILITGQRIIL